MGGQKSKHGPTGTGTGFGAPLRRFCTRLFLVACTGFVGALALSAETILLKNGQILSGSVVSQNKTSITIQTENGRRTISKARIRRIDYKSAEQVRQEEQRRLRREAAERRKKETAERKLAEERAKKEETERLKLEEAERIAKKEAAELVGETDPSEIEPAAEPGLSLGDLLGEFRWGAGFEFHDAASADFFYDAPTNRAGGNHLFERVMGSRSALAPVLFYEQSVWDPRLVPGIEAGFLYREDRLRPGLLVFPELAGWEFFLRPSIGGRFGLTEKLFLHVRGSYSFAVTQLGREFYAPEWTINQGLVLDDLDAIRRYKIHNPQYAGPGLRIGFELNRFRIWFGRQWLSGKAGDARLYRDNWIAGVGVEL